MTKSGHLELALRTTTNMAAPNKSGSVSSVETKNICCLHSSGFEGDLKNFSVKTIATVKYYCVEWRKLEGEKEANWAGKLLVKN